MKAKSEIAAAIGKGDRPVLCLSESDVMNLLDSNELVLGLERGFCDLHRGVVQSPGRPEITVPGKGFSLAMSAWCPGMKLAVKVVNVFEGNLAVNLPNHLATITVYEPDTGELLCVMDGTYITGVRTAAAAIVSVKALARPDARVVTIIGAGVQGREHLRFLPLARDFEVVKIYSLHHDDAQYVADLDPKAEAVRDIESAVRSSDVVCLASHSYEPVIETAWVQPGTHVSSVGYAPPAGELPLDLARNGALFVETRQAFEPPPVGCGELSNMNAQRATTLGELLSGAGPGRVSDEQITVYKAMGIAMEDMVAANLVYRKAVAVNVGTTVRI